MLPQKKLKAIVQLLDDDSVEVWEILKNVIVNEGQEIIPYLERHWEGSTNNMVQERLETMVHQIQFAALKSELTLWINATDQNLLEGTIIIAKYAFPDLDTHKTSQILEQLKEDLFYLDIKSKQPIEQIQTINYTLFNIFGLQINREDYYHINNNCINTVLESKKGNPLLLSIVYLYIAQYFKLPIFGVNLPQYFIICLVQNEVPVFYINVGEQGHIFPKESIYKFLKKLNLEYDEKYFKPCTNKDMILRMLKNLWYSYGLINKEDKKDEITELMNLFEHKK